VSTEAGMMPPGASLLAADSVRGRVPLADGAGGGRPRAWRYDLYPSKSMLMLNFLLGVSWSVLHPSPAQDAPRVVEASRSQCQFGGLLRGAVVAENCTQARLELDVVIPAVSLESLVDIV
jgi:hypothetical protein